MAIVCFPRNLCSPASTLFLVDRTSQVLERTKSRRERLRQEVEIQRKIGKHPHVVELLDVYETSVSVVLVFELMAGELFERIVSLGPYQEQEAAVVTRKLAELLRHLHSMGVVHRDLKPENLLMVSKEPNSEVREMGCC